MGREERINPFARMKKAGSFNPNARADASHVYDALNRELGVGDVVLIADKPAIRWRVAAVRPVLRPDVPAGIIEMTLTTVIITGVEGGKPLTDLYKIIDASEIPAQGVAAPAGQPAGDPQPVDKPVDTAEEPAGPGGA